MREQEIKIFAQSLAGMYWERRKRWYRAVDKVIEARLGNSARELDIAMDARNYAVARWDQMVEVTESLPLEIRTPMLEEVEIIESRGKRL